MKGTIRISTLAAMGALLAACACHRGAPEAPGRAGAGIPSRTTQSAGKGHYDAHAGAQVVALRWNRPGDWTPVRLHARDPRLGAAMLSRDRMGDRIVSVRPTAGYDAHLVDVDCQHRGIVLKASRVVGRDDLRVDPASRGRPLPLEVDPNEIGRICGSAPVAVKGTPEDAVARLREAGDHAAGPSTQLDPQQRERMWREYQARNAGHK
jgi:hypothetical protein